MASLPDQRVVPLARQARERFVVHLGGFLPELVKVCDSHLTAVMGKSGTNSEMALRRDAWTHFQKHQDTWHNLCRKALQRSLQPGFSSTNSASLSAPGQLELVAEGAIDDQIMASRLAMSVLERTSTELNALRLRVQYLERREELPRGDVLLPDVMARLLVDQWIAAGLPREAWPVVQEALAPALATRMLAAYRLANEFLVNSGVMKDIDLQALVKRTPGSRTGSASDRVGEDRSGAASMPGAAGPLRAGVPTLNMEVHHETRMMTSATPLARARMRAQGVLGRLKRMLMDRVGGDFEATQLLPPSPGLQQAMQRSTALDRADSGLPVTGGSGPDAVYVSAAHVERAANALRQRTTELKRAASTPTERATIEVVALMFQSILAEERIPPSVRVWFARLQIPVLRVALAEPEFFSALQHPARSLIDRMGSCVMGFESNVSTAALEAEIKRVVQVIEQYPETGRRVFQLVFDEFQKFLATYLSKQGSASRFVSVAQQVEQKETLSVQYTIELRKLLDDMPVRDEVREFLFKVWVDVLAVATVKYGVKNEETSALKQAASDLLWSASAKPDRLERMRVIQQLPGLLQRLRQGMGLLGYPNALQDQHIKVVGDTLADAFMSRTEPISKDDLDRLSKRLAHLEDFLPESGVGDLEFDSDSIEMIIGVDASNIEMINQGGSQPNEAMRAWAVELQIGAWFGLDHNGKFSSVQLAWRSDRGQLYMFVSNNGHCFLMQVARVASFLQAGLLVPSEEEALTVRATREALTQLEANPERLLG
ncbi:DUF1631 family protein [Hydrogenophaga sp.]|uniref:DUF1631 family protein n=1 Tax=Hydrogenophaga sp. TaxID=1904254 RepID=UPI0027179B97|nr:DUF1631 family protein [Hydrogenophaga sp.]MDO9605958.1 DUF1631 family protein [Hydrogenophaga sp.]